jgi:membrane protein DedA with SNARE-associated domain
MLPVIIVGVVVGDTIIFLTGRYGGRRLLAWPWLQRRVLPVDKQEKIAANFAKNGILILLGARLTPGIRTPVFLMAGVLRMPISRFLLADLLYAIPGVNLLFWLAYIFTDQFVAAVHAVEKHRGTAITFVVGALVGAAATKFLTGRKVSTGDPADIPTVVKPVGMVTQAVEQAVEKTVGKTVTTAAMVMDKVMHPHPKSDPAEAAKQEPAPGGERV